MKTISAVKSAEELIIHGEFNTAKDLLIDALLEDDNNPEIYYLLGDVLCKLNRFDEAITMLRKADKLFPKHPRIYHLLGWAIFMNGDIDSGRAFMEVALTGDPENEQLYADLAVLEMKSNHLDKALHWIFEGKRVIPNDDMLQKVEKMINKIIHLSIKSQKLAN